MKTLKDLRNALSYPYLSKNDIITSHTRTNEQKITPKHTQWFEHQHFLILISYIYTKRESKLNKIAYLSQN